jgi:signal transduction histidine kinase
MRQLLHELRSPLNAINGFAQLIEGQYFGPVGTHYRDLARAIIADSSILSVAFEDLDLAAKMDTGALTLEEGESDLAAMLSLLTEDAGRTIVVEGAGRPVVVAVAGRELHQLLSRLVRHLVDTTPVGATARAILRLNGFGSAELALTSIGISGDESATDLAQSGDGNAFMSLRLVERLAAHVGGSLELSAGKALLNLPCATSETGRFGTVD